jgi:hypothetical protein
MDPVIYISDPSALKVTPCGFPSLPDTSKLLVNVAVDMFQAVLKEY